MKKSEIRKKILKIRKKVSTKNLNIDFKSLLKILKINKISEKNIGGYYPYNYEIDVLKILKKLERSGYKILLPKIKSNHQMDFFNWSTNSPLTINKYGIPEPCSDEVKYPGILLVPLVAFDKNLNRIGYGGGFYDRYIKKIKKIKNITTIGMAYSCQKVKKILVNQYDIKLDFIVTEKEIIRWEYYF